MNAVSPRSTSVSSVDPPPTSTSSARLSPSGEPARDRELDEARLFDALDRLELDAGLAPRPLDQRAAVLGLANRARRDRAVRVDLPPVHLLPELAQRRARLADRGGGEATREEHLGAESHGRAQRGQIFPGRLSASGASGEPLVLCEGPDASTTRRRSALEPTSIAAKRGIRRN